MSEYDPKFFIENLERSNEELLKRMIGVENDLQCLNEAVLKIAGATNTFGNPEIQAKLKQIADRQR